MARLNVLKDSGCNDCLLFDFADVMRGRLFTYSMEYLILLWGKLSVLMDYNVNYIGWIL